MPACELFDAFLNSALILMRICSFIPAVIVTCKACAVLFQDACRSGQKKYTSANMITGGCAQYINDFVWFYILYLLGVLSSLKKLVSGSELMTHYAEQLLSLLKDVQIEQGNL